MGGFYKPSTLAGRRLVANLCVRKVRRPTTGVANAGAIGQLFTLEVKSVIASVPSVEINPLCQGTVNASKSARSHRIVWWG
jgi:hypothetical protein